MVVVVVVAVRARGECWQLVFGASHCVSLTLGCSRLSGWSKGDGKPSCFFLVGERGSGGLGWKSSSLNAKGALIWELCCFHGDGGIRSLQARSCGVACVRKPLSP